MLDSDMVPRPCLVLLDWVMQGMSGDEFLAELGARAAREDVGVIVMSARLNVDVPRKPSILGILQKPFEAEELLSILDRFC